MTQPDIIKIALRILAGIACLLILLAGWLVYQNPDGVGGYLTGALGSLQLVISQIGTAIRASYRLPENGDVQETETEQAQ